MAETSLADVDVEHVLFRLTRHAQALFGAFKALAHERWDIACPGGEGPEDLAMDLLLRFVDPADTKVTWKEDWGRPSTETVLAYLKKALSRDFWDLKKSKRYRTTVFVEDSDADDGEIGFDKWATMAEGPVGQLIKKERTEQLIRSFADDPGAQEMLRLQLDPNGYNAFTNQELADLLDTTVADIENRKKRAQTKLLKILKAQEKGAVANVKA